MNYEKHGHEGGVDCEEEEDLLFHLGLGVLGALFSVVFWFDCGFDCENLFFLI